MGVSILSGVLSSQNEINELQLKNGSANPMKPHLNGNGQNGHTTHSDGPSRFIACVNRQESITRLRRSLSVLDHGRMVELKAQRNVESVLAAEVIILG